MDQAPAPGSRALTRTHSMTRTRFTMARIGRWTDTRSARQHQVATLMPLIALALIVGCLWFRLLLYQALGEPWSSVLALVVAVGPLAGLYRFGVDGQPWRRALVEGSAGGMLIALVYWLAFIRPAVTPWW